MDWTWEHVCVLQIPERGELLMPRFSERASPSSGVHPQGSLHEGACQLTMRGQGLGLTGLCLQPALCPEPGSP